MKSHNIKHILEARRMEVSENSWDKLANQLDANDQKKKRIRLYPYAACIALLVSFIVFMMLKTNTAVGTETIVKTEIKSDNNLLKAESKDETIPTVTEKIITQNNSIASEETTSIPVKEKQLKTELHKEIQNAVVSTEKEIVPKEIETIIAQKEVVIDQNEELKASIAALSASEKVVIKDEEIDELLKKAQKSIQHLNIQDTIDLTTIVSADDLLEEVEYELDTSFKQKVFELIKTNIQKTRTVIADRN